MMMMRPSTSPSYSASNDGNNSNTNKKPKMIRVIAPATLEQDFTFDITLKEGLYGSSSSASNSNTRNGHKNRIYTVTVPEGGVKEGEEFDIPYPDWDEYSSVDMNENNDDNIVANDEALQCQSNSNDNDIEAGGGTIDDHVNNDKNVTGISPRSASTSSSSASGQKPILGRWRTHLLSCCDVVTQATFWMSLFCIPIILAQLVSRLHLSYTGTPVLKNTNSNSGSNRIATTSQTIFEDAIEEASLSYNKIVLSFVFVLCITNVLPAVGLLIVLIYIALLLIIIGSNIRRSMRIKYNIPLSLPFLQTIRKCFCRPLPKRGAGNVKHGSTKIRTKQQLQQNDTFDDTMQYGYVEDCCCMVLCGCCSLIQMARHTHDDTVYPGYCCTTTGLEIHAPRIV